jgi:hypothetical protein
MRIGVDEGVELEAGPSVPLLDGTYSTLDARLFNSCKVDKSG